MAQILTAEKYLDCQQHWCERKEKSPFSTPPLPSFFSLCVVNINWGNISYREQIFQAKNSHQSFSKIWCFYLGG